MKEVKTDRELGGADLLEKRVHNFRQREKRLVFSSRLITARYDAVGDINYSYDNMHCC